MVNPTLHTGPSPAKRLPEAFAGGDEQVKGGDTIKLFSIYLNTMNKFFILFFITSLLSACNETSQNSELTDIKIKVSEKETYYDLTNDIEGEISFIPLETSDECLISNISRIIFANNQFYILDKKSNLIHIFSREGRFINSLDKVGQGPGEYVKIHSFIVAGENIWILDNELRKIICYNKDLSEIESAPLKTWVFDMNYQNGYIYMTHNYWIGESKPLQLSIYDMDRKKIEKCIYSEKLGPNIEHVMMMKQLAVGPSSCLFTYPYTDVIHEIKGDQVIPKYKISFDQRFTFEPKPRGEEGNIIRGICDIDQTNNHVIVTYVDKKSFKYAFFNKETEACNVYDGYVMKQLGDIGTNVFLLYQPDGYMIGNYEPGQLAYQLENNMKHIDADYIHYKNEITTIVNATSEDDNPIIILFKLKENSRL